MKKNVALFLMLFLAAGLAARERRRGWFIEGSLAFSQLAPGDLNARLEAQQERTDFLYKEYYEEQRRTSGGMFTYTLEEPDGSGLQGLRRGLPVDLRVGRSLSPRVAVFAGLQFLGRRKTSWLRQTYRVSDLRPDQVTPGSFVAEVAYPECFLAVRAWIPQLGATIDVFRSRRWTAGLRLAAGPMFASLRTVEAQWSKRTEADGYWTETHYAYDMKGKGVGVALEAAARLALPLSARLGLYIEGGYALRTGSRFSGPGAYESQYRDANAAWDPVRIQWPEGEWRTRRMELHQPWGDLAYTLSGNDLGGYEDAGKFRLDLSGWQAAVGLALAL